MILEVSIDTDSIDWWYKVKSNLELLLDALELLGVVDLQLQTGRFSPQHLLFCLFTTNTNIGTHSINVDDNYLHLYSFVLWRRSENCYKSDIRLVLLLFCTLWPAGLQHQNKNTKLKLFQRVTVLGVQYPSKKLYWELGIPVAPLISSIPFSNSSSDTGCVGPEAKLTGYRLFEYPKPPF